VPLGIWVLGYLAAFAALSRAGYAAARREELFLLVPLIAVLVLVSSQTGFNRHVRYVLPVFPFAFILISRLARAFALRHPGIVAIGIPAFAWSVMSSLMVYPHSMSYFNELGGGPRGGHAHLLSSNIDWGQDLLYLREWYDSHPEARPLHLAYRLPNVDPALVGIDYESVPSTPTPGWHVASVDKLRARNEQLRYLLKAEPVGYAGYSMYVYHLSEEDCERLGRLERRRRLEKRRQEQSE
jgi:hypothetical protein